MYTINLTKGISFLTCDCFSYTSCKETKLYWVFEYSNIFFSSNGTSSLVLAWEDYTIYWALFESRRIYFSLYHSSSPTLAMCILRYTHWGTSLLRLLDSSVLWCFLYVKYICLGEMHAYSSLPWFTILRCSWLLDKLLLAKDKVRVYSQDLSLNK